MMIEPMKCGTEEFEVHLPAELIAAELEPNRVELPQPDENEQQYRELWKRFYQTIAVEGRENPRQRRTMMAKRYWPWITEMQEDPFVLRQKNRERAGSQDILKGTVGAGTQSLPNVVE